MDSLLRYSFHLLILRPLVRGLLGFQARNRERIPRRGPAVIVANHNSHLDVLALATLLPVSLLPIMRPAAASDYFLRNAVLSWVARRILRIIPVDRLSRRGRDGHPLDGCAHALARGEIVVLFPEGTRGEPERLGGLKSGVAYLARRYPTVPVIPVFLRGLGRILPKGGRMPLPLQCSAYVGRALYWQGDRHAYMHRLRRELIALGSDT